MRLRAWAGTALHALAPPLPLPLVLHEIFGGMYAFFFFRIEGWPDARAACLHLLEQTRVGLAPGELFGSPGWIRMCVCRNDEHLARALGRMAKALK